MDAELLLERLSMHLWTHTHAAHALNVPEPADEAIQHRWPGTPPPELAELKIEGEPESVYNQGRHGRVGRMFRTMVALHRI